MRDTIGGGYPASVRMTTPHHLQNYTHYLQKSHRPQPRSQMLQHLICEALLIFQSPFTTCHPGIPSPWPLVTNPFSVLQPLLSGTKHSKRKRNCSRREWPHMESCCTQLPGDEILRSERALREENVLVVLQNSTTLLELCVSSLRRSHANLLFIVSI